MTTVLSFIVAISLLVVIHEYGHFWVARRCGVKVLRFSVGFGTPLWSFRDRHGTEFAIAPLPLGGYVKMLDEREGPVPEEERHMAFTQKTAGQRIAIASAGPIANFLFAIVAYWGLYMAGVTGLAPVIGSVDQESPLAGQVVAGERILAVDDREISSFRDLSWQLISYIGETGEIPLTVTGENLGKREVSVPIEKWLTDEESPDPVGAIGLSPRRLFVAPVLGDILDGGAGAEAGLKKGDVVLSVDGQPVGEWHEWVSVIRDNPGIPVELLVERSGEQVVISLTPGTKEGKDGHSIGYVGVGIAEEAIPEIPPEWLTVVRLGPLDAAWQATRQTWDLIVFTLESLWKMLKGDVSVKNLSGPITIAKVADSSASGGPEAFISFLALLSVSLGVLNLLPVPVLDGGHILYYSIEAIRGKALSERVQILGIKIGMAVLLSVMIVAFYNDISRL